MVIITVISCSFVLLQTTQKWLTEDKKLYKLTDEVDYDAEGMTIISIYFNGKQGNNSQDFQISCQNIKHYMRETIFLILQT